MAPQAKTNTDPKAPPRGNEEGSSYDGVTIRRSRGGSASPLDKSSLSDKREEIQRHTERTAERAGRPAAENKKMQSPGSEQKSNKKPL